MKEFMLIRNDFNFDLGGIITISGNYSTLFTITVLLFASYIVYKIITASLNEKNQVEESRTTTITQNIESNATLGDFIVSNDDDKDEENIKKELPSFDKKEFYNYIYDNFVKIKSAFSEYNYETIKLLTTHDYYNELEKELKKYEDQKLKQICKDFHKIKTEIKNFQILENKIIIMLEITTAYFDYTVDSNNKIIKGKQYNKENKTFSVNVELDKNNIQEKCEHCNANVKNDPDGKCDYCEKDINNPINKWLISNIEVNN